MIVRRIISGGQSGVERAALDLAIQLGISHGGWVAHGRMVDDGLLASRYRLTETAFPEGPASADANLEMSDGVLFLSRGPLSDDTAAVHAKAQARRHPHLLIDFDRYTHFQSSLLINSWLKSEQIEILFITGPRENEQPRIYSDTMGCFQATWWALMMVEPAETRKSSETGRNLPRTLADAVTRLMKELPLKDKVTMANMSADEIAGLNATLGRYVQKHFGLWDGNFELMQACLKAAKREHLADEEVSQMIVERLALKLRETHKLRVL